MAQVVGALARQVEYAQVDFARVDLEACPVRCRCGRCRAHARADTARGALAGAWREEGGAGGADVSLLPCWCVLQGGRREGVHSAHASAGQLLASFSGAMPNRLVELLDLHKGDTQAKRGGRKLLALLGILLAGGACIVLLNAQPQPAAAPPVVPPSPPPQEDEAAGGAEAVAAPDGEPTREPQSPVKKQASSPSKGARLEQ